MSACLEWYHCGGLSLVLMLPGWKCGCGIFAQKELLTGTIKAGVFVFHGVIGARCLLELCLGSHCLSIKGSCSLTLLLHLRMNLIELLLKTDLVVAFMDPCSMVSTFRAGGGFQLSFQHGNKGCKGTRGQGNEKDGKKIVSQKMWGPQEHIGNLSRILPWCRIVQEDPW